jgi:Superinfection immunity protein
MLYFAPALQRGLEVARLIGIVCLGLISILLYFLPSIIAAARHHRNATAIFVLNLLLGWTFLGWVAALVWSLTS